jgi:spore coat polysaccharide biosynthesis protein SpsF
MSEPIIQIQARLGSTRLPGKVLYPLGTRRIIGRVVDRCERANRSDSVVVAIGNQPENDALREWADRNTVPSVTGPEDDLLERHVKTAREMDSDPIIRVTGDCPFVPSDEVDRLITEHENNSARYTTNVTDEMPIGTAVDVIDRVVLEELQALGESHPVKRLRDEPDRWDVAFSPASPWTKLSEAHIAVDTPTDYWLLSDAVSRVGDDPRDVAEWVRKQQDI